MSALWGGRPATVTPPVGACVCGGLTAETDRTGRPYHRACVAAVIATVAREAHPYDDFTGIGPWLRAEESRAAQAALDGAGRGWPR